MDFPLLSVCLITYNHKNYIRQAIEGILMQKVNFTWELIIADDCSTDGTREIILEYKEKYPKFIRLILQSNNVGPARNWLHLLYTPESKYIAYIEGDDYWTYPLKLQVQIDFLESKPDFSICSTNALVRNDSTNIEFEWLGKEQKDVSELADLLRNGSGGASCTLVFRTSILKHIPPWVADATGADWLLQIFATTQGKMKYLKEVTAVYRKNSNSISYSGSLQRSIEIYETYGIMPISTLKKHFGLKYHKLLDAHAAEYWSFGLMKMYLANNERRMARSYAFKVLGNSFRIKEPLKRAITCIKVIILSFIG